MMAQCAVPTPNKDVSRLCLGSRVIAYQALSKLKLKEGLGDEASGCMVAR